MKNESPKKMQHMKVIFVLEGEEEGKRKGWGRKRSGEREKQQKLERHSANILKTITPGLWVIIIFCIKIFI